MSYDTPVVQPRMMHKTLVPAKKDYTLEDYMRDIVKCAGGFTDDNKVVHKPVPQLQNFIKGHDLVGTLRGSPHWVRNSDFYKRNSKV